MSYRQQSASEFAHFVKGLGFRVFLADRGDYGIITDAEGSRVLSFSFTDGSSLSGNYGPPSRESGTGWQIEMDTWDIKTAEDVKRALYATAPDWTRQGERRCHTCGHPQRERGGWRYYTTLEQHLTQYGSSSKYQEV